MPIDARTVTTTSLTGALQGRRCPLGRVLARRLRHRRHARARARARTHLGRPCHLVPPAGIAQPARVSPIQQALSRSITARYWSITDSVTTKKHACAAMS